jgi:HEAT repeat protein
MFFLAIVFSLGLASSDALTEALKKATTAPDPHVRAAAARALGDLGDKSVTPSLIPLLRDREEAVSAAAAEALTKLGDRSVTALFVEMLTATDTNVTSESSGPVFGGGSPALANFARLKREERIAAALQILGRLGDTNAVPAIVEHGVRSSEVGARIAAALALGRIKDRRAVEPLAELLRQHYAALTGQVSGPTIETRPPAAVQRMKENEAYLRAAVAWALGQIGDAQAQSVLLRAADDENSLVRDAAKQALEKLPR